MRKMIQSSGRKLSRVLTNYLTNEGLLPPTTSNFGGGLGEALVTQKGVWGITPKDRWVGTSVLFEQIGKSPDQRVNHFMEFSKDFTQPSSQETRFLVSKDPSYPFKLAIAILNHL